MPGLVAALRDLIVGLIFSTLCIFLSFRCRWLVGEEVDVLGETSGHVHVMVHSVNIGRPE